MLLKKMKQYLRENTLKQKLKTWYDSGLLKRVAFFTACVTAVVIALPLAAHAGDLFSNGEQLISKAGTELTKWVNKAMPVGVGVGALMKKFSFGKERQIELGNKTQSTTLIAWATVNGLSLITGLISPYLK